MTSELKQEYILKISQANKSGLVVIIYEMLLDYLSEAKEYIENENPDAFHDSIRNATGCLRELNNSINKEHEVANNLFSLNIYCMKELAKADLHYSKINIENVEKIIKKLYETMKITAKQDSSDPLMNNTHRVYAGLTYGKESLVVNINSESNRGYTV